MGPQAKDISSKNVGAAKRVASLLAPCGLYCGDCLLYRGEIADLARDLRKALRAAHFERVAAAMPFKTFENYGACYETLGGMVKLRCRRGCRAGGPPCDIKLCVQKKGYAGCWECGRFEDCRKLSRRLTSLHGAAHLKNLRKIAKVGVEALLAAGPQWSD